MTSKKIVASLHSVRSLRMPMESSWRLSRGGSRGATNGSCENLRQGFCGQQRNQVRDEAVIGGGLDDHGQFHRGSFHFDGGLGVGIEGAVNDVGPMDQIGHGRGIEAEALLRDHGNEAGAGLEIGIVELAVALILLEVLGIIGGEEGALVMVEPPGNFGRAGVFEVDDGVLVAVELLFIEQRSGAMDEAGELELGIAADALAVKAGKQRGGGGSVKAFIVIEDPNSQ